MTTTGSPFDAETAITPAGERRWDTHLSGAWTIGAASNGGYALTPVLRALRELAGHSDPITPPEEYVDRSELDQGVELPILSRVEVRLRPDLAEPGAAGEAVVEGWIRFRDGAAPDTMSLPLWCDAFPPSLYPMVRDVGWVPTVELTVHPRRRPAPGWLQASLRCDDLSGGQMIETGTLWDSTGALVAHSRQLGLLLSS